VIEMQRLLSDKEGAIEFQFASNQAKFRFDGMEFVTKLVDGKFPDYNRVIPIGHKNSFSTNRVGVLLAMQRASILSNEKYRGIRMVISANNLKLISTNSDQEEAEEELEVSYQGDALDIGFNVTYLIDVLNNANSEEITFSFSDANSSCLVTIPNKPDYKYVVMPMRI
ncbi:MAG TPA: DNA polymerase III subunit beta, partial [Methylotenera sp.]|nr:DNA polymerase III subunit beta [Methylotenera sp.]